MWEKFAEEICDTLDRSLARVEKRCDNWKDFIDGKKEWFWCKNVFCVI